MSREIEILEEMKTDLTRWKLGQSQRISELASYQAKPGNGEGTSGDPSVAETVFESKDFKAWAPHPRGRLVIPVERKTTITTTAVGNSTPGILVPQRVEGIVAPGVRRLRVRDLMPQYPCTNNAVEFVKENVFTNAASPQTEGSAKSESALTFTLASSAVQTIAHWIPASRQILDDFSQLRSYLDIRLMDGIKDIEDYELMRGTGVGTHLTGLTVGATAYAGTYDVASDTRIDRLNHALAELEDSNQTGTGIVLHPGDWRVIQVVKTNEGGANTGPYILGGPVGMTPNSLWGLPVATTSALTRGTFLVGDFAKCALWLRQELIVELSTEHEDFWTRNLVAIRAEERLTSTIYRSDGFIFGSF